MLSLNIYLSIFEDSPLGAELAKSYSLTAQHELGLEWVARQSNGVARYLAYANIMIGHQDTCLFFNAEIDKLAFELGTVRNPDRDSDFIDVPTIKCLSAILAKKDVEKRFIGQLRMWVSSLTAYRVPCHHDMLRPLNAL